MLIQAYGAQLSGELGERTIDQVRSRLQQMVYQGLSSTVGTYTGKDNCAHPVARTLHGSAFVYLCSPSLVLVQPPGPCTSPRADEFGDLTKKAVADLTGKQVGECAPPQRSSMYLSRCGFAAHAHGRTKSLLACADEFGDITRTIASKLFGKDDEGKRPT